MSLPEPSFTVTYILAVIAALVGLVITFHITNDATGKFIEGLAAIIVPLVLAAIHAAQKTKVHAAKLGLIAAGAPSRVVAPSGWRAKLGAKDALVVAPKGVAPVGKPLRGRAKTVDAEG